MAQPNLLCISGAVTVHILELPPTLPPQPVFSSTATESVLRWTDTSIEVEVGSGPEMAHAVLFVPAHIRFGRLRVTRATLVVSAVGTIQSSTEFELLDGAVVFAPHCSLQRLSLTCGNSPLPLQRPASWPTARPNSFVALGDISCDTLTVRCSAPAKLFGLVVRDSADTQLSDSEAKVHLLVSRLTKLISSGVVSPCVSTAPA